jgi:hypothetical protein
VAAALSAITGVDPNRRITHAAVAAASPPPAEGKGCHPGQAHNLNNAGLPDAERVELACDPDPASAPLAGQLQVG